MPQSPVEMSLVCTLWTAVWMCLLSLVTSACPCEDPALCKPISTSPKKEIFVFSRSNSSDNWSKYNWSLITTVARVGPINTDLMCLAHKHGARIVLMVNFEPITDISNSTKRQIWMKQVVQEVHLNYYDGVNFDVEAAVKPGQKAYRDGYTSLVKETVSALRSYNPWAQVSIDVSHAPYSAGRYYDFVGLAESCDFLVIMDYDEWGGQFMAWANSPYHYALEGILLYMKLRNVTGSKLVIAGPWYGDDYACRMTFPDNICVTVALADGQPEDVQWLSRREGPYRLRNGKQIAYSSIMTLLNTSTTGRLWDNSAQSPYFSYQNPSDHRTHQVWYDDHQSLAVKFGLVHSLGLRGAGVFHVDLIDYSNTPQARQQRSAMWGAFSVVRP